MNRIDELKSEKQSKPFPAFSKALSEGLSILFNEIELAFAWNRPSLLFAIHKSKMGRQKAWRELEKSLTKKNKGIVYLKPDFDHPNLVQLILETSDPDDVVFFVDGLGAHKETLSFLNLHRETLVDNRVKILFWLTETEAKQLPKLAPDFWAFRHRVVEFPYGRGFSRRILPAGILIWLADNTLMDFDSLAERIEAQENLLHALPTVDESVMLRSEAIYLLAFLYWNKGENQKAERLLHQELVSIRLYNIIEVESRLLNGLAILCYEKEDYAEARLTLEQAVAQIPDDEILWVNLGVIYHALGRTRGAIRIINKAIKINPHSSRLWDILGYVQVSIGKFDSALSSFENAVHLDNDDLSAHYALGFCHARMGHFDELQRVMEPLQDHAKSRDIYHSIFRAGILGESTDALEQSSQALRDGTIPERLIRRDPGLNMIFDSKTIKTLVKP